MNGTENIKVNELKKAAELKLANAPKVFTKEQLALNRKKLLVLKIEKAVKEIINTESETQMDVASELVRKLEYNYTYMSNLYSEVRGVPLKTFVISAKVEIIKQLLTEEKHTVREIADMLHYKNISHMSAQFKAVTGVAPSMYLASLLD